MRSALLLAGLLVMASALAVSPAASAGPVRDACDDVPPHVDCSGLFSHCRSTDPLLDAVCRDLYNPLVDAL